MPTAPTLIFDLDGTLADTAPDLLGATNAVLAARERPRLDLDHLRHMVGFGAVALISQAMEASGAPVTEEEMPPLIEIFLDHYRGHIADGTRLFPDVAETLAALKAAGARMGILTNKPQELTDLLMPRLNLGDVFTAVYGAGRKPYTKPDPRIFRDVVAEIFRRRPRRDDRRLHHRSQHRACRGRALHPDVLRLHAGAGGGIGRRCGAG
jgi:phosphoglycolate phosphatase